MPRHRPSLRPRGPLGIANALCATFLLAACASAGGGSALNNAGGVTTIRQMMRLAGAHFVDPNALDDEVLSVDTVAAPPDQAWKGLIRAYTALRIPVTRFDENMLWIGGSTQPLGAIGGSRPSAWLDCGHGMADQYADAYLVTFSIATRVVLLDANRSTLQSLVMASAQPRDVSTASFKCSTKGTLEHKIGDIVRGQATAPTEGVR
jgi:hypothetical protein